MGPGSYGGNPKTKLGPVWREDSRWRVRLKARLDMGGINRWDVESSCELFNMGFCSSFKSPLLKMSKVGEKNLEN